MALKPTRRWIAAAALLSVGSVVLTPSVMASPSKDQQRAKAREAADQTMQQLYKVQPSARPLVEKAAGHAAFSNFGMKILVAGGGKGEGVAVNHKTKKETFMRMVEVQAGVGFGVKKFRLIWVFETQDGFDKFVNSGWELGAQASVGAQMSGQGLAAAGAIPVSPGIWLFQLSDDGVALELTAKGTKYYKDDALN